ncbi:biotin transporter BioY [uncultured Tessaracoccus sp.]|uniref:biotin transporter BioY n=1 Tax=uncultured Tessaracoccus sp. TaxID=905023 RepID=UPI00262B0603|nr:biotin transporter BioY [uncultured Tessaracoccus sp.]
MSDASATTRPATRTFEASDMAYIAVFAALIAALSVMPAIPVGGLGIPITLQTLGITLTALVLGPWRGAAAVLLYLLMGTAGLPIFAKGKAGLAPWFGPTVGYLIAFVVCTIVVGLISRRILRNGLQKLTWLWLTLTVLACRVLIMYPLGTLGIAMTTKDPFAKTLAADLIFWPGDVLKTIVAVVVALAIFKAFPRLMQR